MQVNEVSKKVILNITGEAKDDNGLSLTTTRTKWGLYPSKVYEVHVTVLETEFPSELSLLLG